MFHDVTNSISNGRGRGTVIRDGLAFLRMVGGVHVTHLGRILFIRADVKTESGGLDVAMAPQEESTEDGLGHDVEDTVEDGFGIGGDDVAALAEAPGDGVQEPEADGPDAADGVGFGDVAAERCGVLAGGDGHGEGDPQECRAAEDEITPLMGCQRFF